MQLEALRYRFQTLAWELGTLVRGTSPALGRDLVGPTASVRGTTLTPEGPEEAFQRFAEKVAKEFRHAALAIGEQDKILYAQGVGGGRFEAAFKQFFWSLFEGKSRVTLGLYDGFGDRRAFGNFAEFNVRWSLSGSFYAGTREIAVWFGYRPDRQPTETELLRFPLLVEEFAGQVRIAEERRLFTSRARDAEHRSEQSTRMIAEISHDIRSPLSNIKAILNVLRLEGLTSDTPQLLQVAESNCGSMNEILESLLDFSRLQTGLLEPRSDVVSLNQVVEAVGQAYMVAARLKGVELLVQVPSDDLEIVIDRVHLKRMLTNLVSNALKYTEQGQVTVTLERRAVGASISVADTGRGMTPEQLQQLFVPFSRFHTEMADGIGLGLALTRSLGSLNNVELGVHSESQKGSTFTMTLRNPVSARARRDILPQELVRSPIKRKVLMVDDNRDSVDTLARNLELRGVEVRKAYSVPEATSALDASSASRPFDAVVSDVHMPKGGIEALLAHRALMESPPAVIVLSGSISSSQRLLKSGVSRILTKPADIEELVLEIERCSLLPSEGLVRAA